MKKIPLTKGKYALVDDEDYEELNKYNWYAFRSKLEDSYYAARRILLNDGRSRTIFMHRIIVGVHKGKETDHVNGNGLDNQRANLRLVTGSQNQQNRKIGKNNTSGYKGVTWNKKDKLWRAVIKINGIEKYLGGYKNKLEAAMKWTEEKLNKLAEINSKKKIPRYFAIKDFVNEIHDEIMIQSNPAFNEKTLDKMCNKKCN